MKWLPFYYEIFCPIAIFQGRLNGNEMLGALVIQAGWMIAMWVGASLMWRRGLGHYQAVGG
jgi:ABC-2 type transport system permease protein